MPEMDPKVALEVVGGLVGIGTVVFGIGRAWALVQGSTKAADKTAESRLAQLSKLDEERQVDFKRRLDDTQEAIKSGQGELKRHLDTRLDTISEELQTIRKEYQTRDQAKERAAADEKLLALQFREYERRLSELEETRMEQARKAARRRT